MLASPERNNDGTEPGAQPCGPWAPRTRLSTREPSLADSCPLASAPSAESNPHASIRRMAKIYFRGWREREGKRMSSMNEGEKCTRDWAKTAWSGAQTAGCHGNRRQVPGRPTAWSSPAADQEACTSSGAIRTRLRSDAALYEPALTRKPRQNGRPRLKGQCLPTLAQVLVNPATAVWYHSRMPPLPIRWVLVRDPP
jgi:hypothetical protein